MASFLIIKGKLAPFFSLHFLNEIRSSSSSSSLPFPAPLQEKYDVFLSFRGEDTRDAFTSHLHKALLGKNIDTYIDNRLEKGDDIGPTLLQAIEKSELALGMKTRYIIYASFSSCITCGLESNNILQANLLILV
ncbi:hypothetical protein PRUPE_I001900 [Prunus persica]|uniref:TIR domain-containing protein n=1 Tax=Prunus persica TaxID=3760 RepID=A0A1R3L531_PRUPE|nr:hypothetical protein PRUPE_I001900 [Prunus persica]